MTDITYANAIIYSISQMHGWPLQHFQSPVQVACCSWT